MAPTGNIRMGKTTSMAAGGMPVYGDIRRDVVLDHSRQIRFAALSKEDPSRVGGGIIGDGVLISCNRHISIEDSSATTNRVYARAEVRD